MMLRNVLVCCLLLSAPVSPSAEPGPASLAIADADVSLRNLTYLDAAGRRVEATFVSPPGATPHPAVLFVHWLDPNSPSNGRTQFLPDALALARQGVAALLIDTPWSDPQWFRTRDTSQDLAVSQQWLQNLRRALDVLAAMDHVDAARLAYVGHDFGAMYGATLASLDRRPTAWVYIAGTARYAEWLTLGRKLDAAQRAQVFATFKPLDPVEQMGAAAPSAILFQFADKDPFVTRAAADSLVAAATSPRDVRFYDCGHEMNRRAMDDRVEWLAKALGLGK